MKPPSTLFILALPHMPADLNVVPRQLLPEYPKAVSIECCTGIPSPWKRFWLMPSGSLCFIQTLPSLAPSSKAEAIGMLSMPSIFFSLYIFSLPEIFSIYVYCISVISII